MTSEYWRDVEYAMGPKRPDPPGFEIMDAIHRAAITTLGQGAKIRVTSGQEGDQPQHGSNRHKTGLAADFQVFRPDGTLVGVGDPDALNFASKAAQFGVRGIGAGNEYMGANTFHFDMMPHADYGPNQGPVWGSWAKDNRQALLQAMGLGPMEPGQQQQPGIMDFIQAGGRAVKKGLQNGDLMDRLALGFNTMRLEPDPNLAAGIRESMADRRERTATSGAANRSVDVLRKMTGPDGKPIPEALEAANAIEANPGMAMQILNSFYQMRASGRLAQQTSRYQLPDGVVTITTLKNNKTVVKLNGQEVTDPAKISELVGQAQDFEIEQEARIAGGKSFATSEAERAAEVKVRYRNAVQLEDRSISIISRMLDDPQGLIDGLGPLVSMVTSSSEGFGALSDAAKNFITNHEQLMGTVFTDVFEALKGGGSITENETRQAKQAAARMNRALNPSDYIDALREYRYRLGRAIEAYQGEMLDQEPTRTNTELDFNIFPEEL